MSFPQNTVVIGAARAITPAIILKPEYDRCNSGALRLRQQSASGTLVSFVSGAIVRGDNSPAGTHDGLRDGENNTVRTDFSRMLRYICTAEDWEAAGNPLP
ncbi:MAG: hypothetical protein GVY22_01810 [Gammaproteobacteria bacterium]|jgi:hypothetical protein|nr:hypothetical protein [Gammaproteobacteria bacterium]